MLPDLLCLQKKEMFSPAQQERRTAGEWGKNGFGPWVRMPIRTHGPRPSRYTGRMLFSKIDVGKARVQQALGISTMPLTRPSHGQQLRRR
jgi:hypothetical protein